MVSGGNLNSSKLSYMSLLPARMKMIQSKMKELEWSQHFSYGDFFKCSRAANFASLVRSGRISNSFEMLWMASLPARMRKIRSKMKALEWSKDFPHYNPMGAINCHGNQSSDSIWPKT